ncbi:Flavocytochrome c [Mycena sp. CBHHK59/15]|nr:Flavocytochrome c [Mycena sp. CBHHK59/15]
MSVHRTIVVGGGLAGLSAAHTLLERGSTVLLLDKKPSYPVHFGIDSVGTPSRPALGSTALVPQRSRRTSYSDTAASAGPNLARPDLITALTSNSAPAIAWLTGKFGVDLSLVSRLGGHSAARTHRDKSDDARIAIVKGARVVKLLEESGRVAGVVYEVGGETVTEHGSVILATGGYAADFSTGGLLAKHRPELLALSTTNGDHATGDGPRLATASRAPRALHPTGFVDPASPAAKTKFLAAEALRGVGGLLLDAHGARFVNEVDRRDVVTAAMQEAAGPVRLVLNAQAAGEVKSHCDFYTSKGLMKRYANAAEFAEDAGIPLAQIESTFASHSAYAAGSEKDPFGKPIFHNAIYMADGTLHVAIITPVVHYTMGGIIVDAHARVLDDTSAPIAGLFAAGEVIGGVHGRNRLAGSSLLEAVVFGRLAGESASVAA